MRSQIQPEASRLTTPNPSMSDSIRAPRAAPWPRSAEYATMCTCGIDIATQQLRPAITSTICRAPGDIPSGRSVPAAACCAGEATAVRGERRRSTSESGTIVVTQKTAMPR